MSSPARVLGAELANFWRPDGRFVAKRGRWYFWDGSDWQRDDRLLHHTRAREFLRAKAVERPDKDLRSAAMLKSVLWFAGSLLTVERVRDLQREVAA